MIEENTKEADRLISNAMRIAEHPWAAIEDGYVWTLDPVDLRQPIKQFPKESWLREVTDIWFKEPLSAWPKSRRMKMSWLMIWNHLWLAMMHEGAAVYIQSETELKSNELVQRAEFIYNHIPQSEFIRPKLKGNRAMWCLMDFQLMHSKLVGVPQGANQLRQFTGTAYLGDEIAFWEKGRESYTATKPITEGGGKVTLISSAQAGFFKDLVYDVL